MSLLDGRSVCYKPRFASGSKQSQLESISEEQAQLSVVNNKNSFFCGHLHIKDSMVYVSCLHGFYLIFGCTLLALAVLDGYLARRMMYFLVSAYAAFCIFAIFAVVGSFWAIRFAALLFPLRILQLVMIAMMAVYTFYGLWVLYGAIRLEYTGETVAWGVVVAASSIPFLGFHLYAIFITSRYHRFIRRKSKICQRPVPLWETKALSYQEPRCGLSVRQQDDGYCILNNITGSVRSVAAISIPGCSPHPDTHIHPLSLTVARSSPLTPLITSSPSVVSSAVEV